MCGIAGILSSDSTSDLLGRLERMQICLRHRGPDDHGIYSSPDGRSGLAHTRLAILDLSPAGHQPMASPDGRFHITFNGEIYNFLALRSELEAAGEVFQSRTDTEVVLRMYQRYGTACVREFEGMFAIAVWDEREQRCFLARDPLGIKPLYYAQQAKTFVFASEIRALLAAGVMPLRLAASALQGYFLFGSVQEPETLVKNVRSLPAGHFMTWCKGEIGMRRFWDVQFVDELFEPKQAVAATRAALEDSVQRHFVSDVPVGIFLSGGIDSTALVALAGRVGARGLRTFCISFDDPKLNEGNAAAETARHFGTEHQDWRLDSTMGRTLLTEFLARFDQPSIDGFNTFCVSKHAHDHGVKVVLSGLGGDELFGSYPSFNLVPRLVKTSRWLSLAGPLRRSAGGFLERHSAQARLRRLGSFFSGPPSSAAAYRCVRGIFTPAESAMLLRNYLPEDESAEDIAARDFHVPAQPTIKDEVSYLELSRYMRNQLLRDSDVMSMSWGLELRVPFVDRKLIETLARIPAALRLARGKQLLLQAVPEIPGWVAQRPKQGFVFPFKNWLTENWHDVFERINAKSPVPLGSWYRRWCLFALENFLQINGIDAARFSDAPRA